MSREECVQFLLESKTSFNDPFFSDRFLLHFIYFSRENDARYDSFDSPSPWSYSWKDFSLSSCFHFLPARRLFLTNFPPRVRSIKQWSYFFPFDLLSIRRRELKLNIFSILLLLPQINSIFLFLFVRFFRFIFRKSTRNLSQFKMKRNRVWVSPRRSHFSFKESPFLLLRSLVFLSSSLRRDPPKLVAVSLSGVGRAGWGGGGGKDDELAEPQGRYSLALLFSMQGDQKRVVEAETKALWFETITSGEGGMLHLRFEKWMEMERSNLFWKDTLLKYVLNFFK